MPTMIKRTWQADFSGAGPRSARQAFDYYAFVPDRIAGLSMAFEGSVVQAMSDAEQAVRRLQADPKAPGLAAFGRLLLRSESIASSYIEGLAVSPRKIAEAALHPDASPDSVREVMGNIRAMETGIVEASISGAIAVDQLVSIHRKLFEGTRLRAIAGTIRDRQNWVGGDEYSPRRATFIPPPESLVGDLLEDLCAFMNREDFPAVAQAAIAHAQFETIHPFADGNGRVGRALIHVVLMRRGIAPRLVPPVSIALASNSMLYLEGLKAFERGDVGDWCADFADALEWASGIALRLAAQLQDLQQGWQRSLRPRSGSAQAKLIWTLSALPVLDVKTAASTIGVSPEAARLAILELEKAGVVSPSVLGKQKYRVWRVPAVLELLEEAEQYLKVPGVTR